MTPEEAQNNQNTVQEGAQGVPAGGSAVVYGDSDATRSLWMISQQNGITVDELYQLNPGITDSNVQPGQQIRIK